MNKDTAPVTIAASPAKNIGTRATNASGKRNKLPSEPVTYTGPHNTAKMTIKMKYALAAVMTLSNASTCAEFCGERRRFRE